MSAREKKFDRLDALGVRLNDAADRVNEKIGEVEDRIVSANLGVTAWLYGPNAFLGVSQWEGHGSSYGSSAVLTATGWMLGFGKLTDNWKILVRRVELARDSDTSPISYHEPEDPVALLRAPRPIRIEAMGKMDDLLDLLASEAIKLLTAMDVASGHLQKVHDPTPALGRVGPVSSLSEAVEVADAVQSLSVTLGLAVPAIEAAQRADGLVTFGEGVKAIEAAESAKGFVRLSELLDEAKNAHPGSRISPKKGGK